MTTNGFGTFKVVKNEATSETTHEDLGARVRRTAEYVNPDEVPPVLEVGLVFRGQESGVPTYRPSKETPDGRPTAPAVVIPLELVSSKRPRLSCGHADAPASTACAAGRRSGAPARRPRADGEWLPRPHLGVHGQEPQDAAGEALGARGNQGGIGALAVLPVRRARGRGRSASQTPLVPSPLREAQEFSVTPRSGRW